MGNPGNQGPDKTVPEVHGPFTHVMGETDYEGRRWPKLRWGHDDKYYEDLYQQQDGRCGICRRNVTRNEAMIDHDHATAQARGLLCFRCNCGLGFFLDDPHIIARALVYLEDWA